MNKIVTIVVTYNGIKWIDECLNSVLNSSIPIVLLVVDNNSSDGTVEYIKAIFPNVILLEQNINLGFGKANNLGISYAIKQNADFVFLLNQDAFVDKNTIEKLAEMSLNKPEFGILSSVQLDYTGKLLENYFFRFMVSDSSRTFYSDFVLKNELKAIYEIDFIQAAAWLLPINTIKTIGGFDPIFFHYGEDDNYCQRVLFHNLKIGVVPEVFIRHDSNKPVVEDLKLFSERYFNDFKKNICTRFANINKPFTFEEICKERKTIYLTILFQILKLNIFKVKGFFKKLKIFNQTIKRVENSRIINIQINANYVDAK